MKNAATGSLLRSLEAILFEVQQMEDTLRDARDIDDGDRRRLRCDTQELKQRANHLMDWLGEMRLETPKN